MPPESIIQFPAVLCLETSQLDLTLSHTNRANTSMITVDVAQAKVVPETSVQGATGPYTANLRYMMTPISESKLC